MRKMLGLIGVLLVVSLLAVLLAGCKSQPLTVTVLEPKQGATITVSPVTVSGNVSDAKVTVWVNDNIVTVTKYTRGGGWFSSEVGLNEGENTIKVLAARGTPNKWKDVVERQVTVTYKSS